MALRSTAGQSVVKRCEELGNCNEGKALAFHVGVHGWVLTDKASIANDSDIDGKRGLALGSSVVHKGVLERTSGRIVRLGWVTDDSGDGRQDDEKVHISWQNLVQVLGSSNLGGQRRIPLLMGHLVKQYVLFGHAWSVTCSSVHNIDAITYLKRHSGVNDTSNLAYAL